LIAKGKESEKMSIKKMILAIVLIITMTLPQVALAAPDNAPEVKTARTVQPRAKKGWVTENGKYKYYLTSNTFVKSDWKQISKKWYYFDKNGFVTLGWKKISGKIYYFKKTGGAGTRGRMLTGWQKAGNNRYYFEKSGALVTGWKQINKKWFYFKKTGKLGTIGKMMTNWQKSGGKVYYFKTTGAKGTIGRMMTGWQKSKGNHYYFNSSGALQTGWVKVKNDWYYLKPTGAYGELGKRLTGWQTIAKKKYYLDPTSGKMLTGWQVIDGNDCYFGSSGAYEAKKEKSMKLIAIDAGHQKKGDSSLEPIGPGSSTKKPKVSSGTYGKWSKLNEYELNLIVAKKLETELKARGYRVYMIRTTHDVNISNSQRAKNAAKAGADILVRIHANGDSNSSVFGALTMAPGNNNTFLTKKNISESQRLSRDLINGYCKATSKKNLGVQLHNDMSGINWSTIPVTIMEMGFMSNKTDDLDMANATYQGMAVKGMANGIDQYFK
jgi:N-acetylmuramoyl-L-alanine amidase